MSRLDGEVAEALARAGSELPPGPVVERLRNYCGRVWEVLCTPAFADAYGQALAHPRQEAAAIPARLLETCLAGTHRLLVEGVHSGQLQPLSYGPVARLLVSSLLARAHWCAHPDTIDPRLAGTCSRVVAETLDLLLPAITAEPRGES